jgi:hypothetical protein
LTVPLAAEQLSSTQGSKLDPRITGAELPRSASACAAKDSMASASRASNWQPRRPEWPETRRSDVAVGQVQISGLADLTSWAKHPRQLQLAVVRDRNLEFLSCSRGRSAP